MKHRSIKSILIIILLFIMLILLVLLLNINDNTLVINNSSKLYISEIMSSNQSIIRDSDNEYSDYIEIYNGYDHEINLKDYFLSDELMSNKKWIFPDIIIKSHEYLIVYASGKNKCDLSIRECHTNFKLNSDGETVSLLNNDGKVISKVKYPESIPDASYSLIDNVYKITVASPYTENEYIKINTDNTKDIIINEVVATSDPESIELRNLTDKDINLSNYYIKNKSNTIYRFDDVKIKANSYLVVYGSDTANIIDNKIYVGFRINNNSDILYLYKNNQLIDTFDVGKITNNISKGRNENLETVIYKDITIGKKNSKTYYNGFSNTPNFSNDGGYVEKDVKVELTTSDNSNIYYTLDGSTPTNKSKKYTNAITIDSNTVIKAISYKDGYVESDVESRTYLVGREHELPVISISTNNSYLYGNNGIFTMGSNASYVYPYAGANFWNDVEVPISFEYYEEGNLGVSINAGLKIFGGWSRGEAQKSVAIYFREKYGANELTYPFYTDNINTFTRLVLRNSGQDYGNTKLKDAFLQEVLDGQMDIDKQDYKFVVVYINGKYNGIYNIREKTDSSYIERHYGYTKEEIDFIQGRSTIEEGNLTQYKELLNYVKTTDMTTEEAYNYVDSQIDLQELMNYWVTETFYGQSDPINIKFYKPKEGGKWRWIVYDLDQTFYSTSIRWELPFSHEVPGHSYTMDATLMTNLIKNSKIRKLYIETFSYHLKNTFKPERMYKILDSMVKEIESEMPYHIDRWYYESIRTSQYTITSMTHWKNNIANLKSMIKYRYQNALNTVKSGLKLTEEEYNQHFKDI